MAGQIAPNTKESEGRHNTLENSNIAIGCIGDLWNLVVHHGQVLSVEDGRTSKKASKVVGVSKVVQQRRKCRNTSLLTNGVSVLLFGIGRGLEDFFSVSLEGSGHSQANTLS